MAIPRNITKEHILKAIEEVSESEIPKERLSHQYYLLHRDKILPPKYIVSVANRFANGELLDSDFFNAIEAKDFLLKNNFTIHEGNAINHIETKYWVEKTIVKGRLDRIEGDRSLGKALWSPQQDSRGADIYKNMKLVNEGDIVLHLIDNTKILGVSKIKSKAIESDGLDGTAWSGPAYLVELENYTELPEPILRGELLNEANKKELLRIAKSSEVFYNNKLDLRQGAYLTPCPSDLLLLINNAYKTKTSNNLPLIDRFNFERNLKRTMSFDLKEFLSCLSNSGMQVSEVLVTRFIGSLASKPFVILTGLSGSGKTKLAQAFARWICNDQSQYSVIPVGADWTNREPLLGYPNALKPEEYVKPDSGTLDLIIQANESPDLPHFLILDEMNLSHVERYFADFLSVMESKEKIPLYAEGLVDNGVPAMLRLPSNLFIIGTVNIDETTNMFSPKVLDRANTIEFRVTSNEMHEFLENIKDINMNLLNSKGADMAKSFLQLAERKSFSTPNIEGINKTLLRFFDELKKAGAEFGYRSATEMLRLIHQLTVLDENLPTNEKLDIAIIQKLLPKLHGSRRKLCPVLVTLGSFCVEGDLKIEKDVFDKEDFDFNGANVRYPLSLEKIARMYKGAIDNGFTSFAEA